MGVNERSRSRRAFLRSAASLVGLGAGAAFLGASPAQGLAPPTTTCCRGSADHCPDCPGPDVKYWCQSDCRTSYCTCHAPAGSCFRFECA
jgi:hypothetical protein